MIEEIIKFAREESVSVLFLVIALLTFLGVSYWQWYKSRKVKKQNGNQQNDIFCSECGAKKESRFCRNCGKETPNNYVIKPGTAQIKLEGKPVGGSIKRGETSLSYFRFAYGVLVAIFMAITSALEISWNIKIILFISCAIGLFYLCFFNDYFRRKIVGIMNKAKSHEEKF